MMVGLHGRWGKATKKALAAVPGKRYSMNMKSWFITLALALLTGVLFLLGPIAGSLASPCTPTEPDMLGPFYTPNAPIRSRVGKGYVLKGVVRSTDCSPVPGATIELWLAGPNREYDDAHRATIIADSSGSYRFESNVPLPYGGRPPHIHLRISARGYRTLVTQHYPAANRKEAAFDVVLVPSP
jgi:protocatechuate 3,4-dioxygenase beta subunit